MKTAHNMTIEEAYAEVEKFKTFMRKKAVTACRPSEAAIALRTLQAIEAVMQNMYDRGYTEGREQGYAEHQDHIRGGGL